MKFSKQLITQYQIIFQKLFDKKLMISCAESCTGGLLCGLLTEIDGASKVFDCGFITYSNNSKVALLGVDLQLIEKYGAVSHEVALAMAKGAFKNSSAQIAISITGIAGPSGSTKDKKVGTVFIGLVANNYEIVKKFSFDSSNRQSNRDSSLREALNLILNYLEI